MNSDPAHAALNETDLSEAPKFKKEMNFQTLHVKVYSPQHIYFDEVATSVSAENATGPFDILPGHHKFITLLDPCELEVRRPGNQDVQRIKISGGFMHVTPEKASVFLDI